MNILSNAESFLFLEVTQLNFYTSLLRAINLILYSEGPLKCLLMNYFNIKYLLLLWSFPAHGQKYEDTQTLLPCVMVEHVIPKS